MKKITLENGKVVEISDESYEALAKAVSVPTYDEIENALIFAHTGMSLISEEHHIKLRAINKLLFVAKYLNGDWKPDWNNEYEPKSIFSIMGGNLVITRVQMVVYGFVYFKSNIVATRAIEILGEETIKTALS